MPELLARESMAPPWRELVRIYRRAEARGEIRGGRFVAGFVGEQFALPEAVETLRAMRKTDPKGELITIYACDPLNVVGILTPGSRVPAVVGNSIVYRDGVPICSMEGGELVERSNLDETARESLRFLKTKPRGGCSVPLDPARLPRPDLFGYRRNEAVVASDGRSGSDRGRRERSGPGRDRSLLHAEDRGFLPFT